MVADITTQGSLLPIITCLLGKVKITMIIFHILVSQLLHFNFKYLQLFGEQEAMQDHNLKHKDECFPLVMQFYDQVGF